MVRWVASHRRRACSSSVARPPSPPRPPPGRAPTRASAPALRSSDAPGPAAACATAPPGTPRCSPSATYLRTQHAAANGFAIRAAEAAHARTGERGGHCARSSSCLRVSVSRLGSRIPGWPTPPVFVKRNGYWHSRSCAQRHSATVVSRPFLPQISPILRHFSPVLSVLAPGSRKPQKNGEKTAQNGRKVAEKTGGKWRWDTCVQHRIFSRRLSVRSSGQQRSEGSVGTA